ncbi:MAG: hypothetical protein C0404_03920 [Verrucomicrobia bacterium]|nr:hypothetical protein [Verrucomicrobiota bacterium]
MAMRTFLFILVAIVCLSATVRADSLIVTTDSTGIQATNVRTDRDTVSFKDVETGADKTMPTNKVDGIVPFVSKGKDYKPEEIQQNIELLKKLKLKHKTLIKYLNQLQNEWEAMQKPAKEYDKDIDNLVNGFKNGDRSTTAYKGVTMSLGMIRFKDVHKKYSERIDAALAEVRDAYLAGIIARFSTLATSNRLSIAEFARVREMTSDISDHGDMKHKEKAAKLLNQARQTTLDVCSQDAVAMYSGKQNIEAYLRSRDTFLKLKEEVAAGDAQKKKLDELMAAQLADMAKSMPAYRFDGGFAWEGGDLQAYEDSKAYSVRAKVSSLQEEPQCYVIPTGQPELLKPGTAFTMPLRLVFNRAQPTNRFYAVAFMLNGTPAPFVHHIELGKLQIVDGHVNASVKEEFLNLQKDFKPVVDPEGKSFYMFYVAWKRPDAAKGDEWAPISQAFAIKSAN